MSTSSDDMYLYTAIDMESVDGKHEAAVCATVEAVADKFRAHAKRERKSGKPGPDQNVYRLHVTSGRMERLDVTQVGEPVITADGSVDSLFRLLDDEAVLHQFSVRTADSDLTRTADGPEGLFPPVQFTPGSSAYIPSQDNRGDGDEPEETAAAAGLTDDGEGEADRSNVVAISTAHH